MNTMSKPIAILLAASVLAVGGCGKEQHSSPADKIVERPPSKLPVYNSRRIQPAWLHEDPVPEKDIHHVLDFSLTDQQGQTRTLADLDGKLYVDRMESMESLTFLGEFERYVRPKLVEEVNEN